MSLIIDGTSGLTFPNSTVQASAKNILQVVTGITTSTTTTTAGPTDTSLTATITPKFSTSKILIFVNGRMYNPNTGPDNSWYIYRNGSSVWNSRYMYSGAGALAVYQFTSYLDSPATTSATTYKLYMSTTGGTLYYVSDVSNAMTLMEIAA